MSQDVADMVGLRQQREDLPSDTTIEIHKTECRGRWIIGTADRAEAAFLQQAMVEIVDGTVATNGGSIAIWDDHL